MQLPRPLVQLCRAGLDSVSFRRALRPRLQRVLPFAAYCVNTVDPESLLITSSIGDGLSPAAARRLFELEEAATDFNVLSELARGPELVATIWNATQGDVTRSQRMRELFLPLGWADELRAALVVDDSCWGYLHLFRRQDQPRFSERETRLLQVLCPLLGAALRAAYLHGETSAEALAPAVVLLDARGDLAGQSPSAGEWLTQLAGDVGGRLPHALQATEARTRAGRGALARYRTPRGEWIGLQGSQLLENTALILSSPGARERSRLLLMAHGLTPRERDVARLLARGISNADIAAALGISLHTAKDHVKAILEKTSTRTRAAFIAALDV